MSNPNSPFGFQWIGPAPESGPVTGAPVRRKIAAANNTPICYGDLVQSLATGYVALGAAGVSGSVSPGIFVGCEYLSSATGQWKQSPYWPNGDHAYDGWAYIIPLAGNLFKVQATATNFTLGDVANNCDISVGTQTITGSYGLSGMTLSRATIGVTATLPFQIYGLWSDIAPAGTPGTDNTSNYNIVVVKGNPYSYTGI